jgi:autotransporter-associated beta strand protein
LVFSNKAQNFTNTNDISTSFGVQSITFSGDSNYIIGGNAITLNGGVLLDNTVTTGSDTLNLNITLGAAQTWTVTNANATLTVAGVLSGAAGAGLTKSGDGTLALTGTNAAYQGGVTLTAGTLSLGNGLALGTAPANLNGGVLQASTAVTVNNPFTVNGPATVGGSNNLTFMGTGDLNGGGVPDTFTINTSATVTFSGLLRGMIGITKEGSGTLVLGSANTYANKTVINGGTLQLMANNAIPNALGVTVAQGATLDLNNFNEQVDSLSGAGTVTLGRGTLTVGSANSSSFSGVISGSGGLTIMGTGTVTLSGNNTYTGPTTVNAGTLQFGADNSVPSGSAATVAAGATFDLNNFSDALGSLAGAGNVSLGSGNLSIGGDNTNTTFSGVISGTGFLTKVGNGTLTLSGDNTYTGATTAMAGTLLINGSQPGSNVTVNSGAVLGGAGTVGTITAAGTLSPGGPQGTGALQSGNVVLAAGATVAVMVNGNMAGTGYDQLNVTGAVDLSANPNLNLTMLFGASTGDTFTIITAANGLTGMFAGLPDNSLITANGQTFRINYSGNAATLTRTASGTTTVVTSSVNPSVFGQPITFTSTVSPVPPLTGTPTGTVTFMEGTNTLGMGTLANGVASFTTTTPLDVGPHSITAVYSGDNSFGGSTSLALAVTVNQALSITTVASSPNPSSVGQSVTLTATVTAMAPGGGTPTGTVTFQDGVTVLGNGSLDSNGRATFSTSSLALGTHTITAVYGGDMNFTTSTSLPFSQNVLPPTMTTLTASPNPSQYGQPVTFTVTVAPVAPGTGTPTGMVTFQEGATVLGTATLSGGSATFTTSALAAGQHAITATYQGDTNLGPSTSDIVSQMVNQASTTITVSSSANPSAVGQAITFTATVTAISPGSRVPTGMVTFMEGTTTLGTGTIDANGHATFQTSSLAQGTHTITATYGGDTNFLSSMSSALSQNVLPATTTILTSSPNPSVFGQPVTFTATVTSTLAGTPTGTVTFMDGTAVVGTGTVNGGVATFASSTLSAGLHLITAVYSGDSTFGPSTSTSVSQSVNRASTTTTVSSSLNPSMSGQTVTFTAVVSAAVPGAGTPTGTVTFMDGSTFLGTGSLSGGRATFQTSTLSVATHQITAVYSGDANFTGSTSAALTQTVNQSGTPNQRFVTQVYHDLLGRAPDPGGLSHFSSLLDMNQATRSQVAELIQSSQEGRTQQVQTLFQMFLGRQADAVGLDLSTRWLGMGGSFFQLQSAIVSSQEYFQRAGGTNNGYLTTVYRDALGRSIDSVGQSLGSQALAGGASRANVADAVFTSQEGFQHLVQSFYSQFLHRTAEPSALNASTTALQLRVQQQQQAMNLTEEQQEDQAENGPPPPAGASVDQLIGVIVGSDEYFGRV